MSDTSFINLEEHTDYPEIIVVISYLSLFSVAGSIGNAFVIYVFSRKRDKSTTTLFILTLAGTDLFTCLVIVPYTIYYEIMAKRVNNDIVCKIYQFLITSNVPFSAFIMVVIAFDRYFKICRPWNHVLDVHLARKIIIALLFFAISLGVVSAFTHGVVLQTGTNTTFKGVVVNEIALNDTQPLGNSSGRLNYSRWALISALTTPDRSSLSGGFTQKLSLNDSQITTQLVDYVGMCRPSYDYIKPQVLLGYQKFYASLFLISFALVAILYSIIFRTISWRRNQRTQRALLNGENRRTSEPLHTLTHTCTVTTRLTTCEDGEGEKSKRAPQKSASEIQRKRKERNKSTRDRNKSIRDKQRLANVKTAGILFIVTAVFILAFLPAWLMAILLVPPNIIVFYMYYIYNVANPIIYAFFNITFRKEMREVLNCR